MKIIKICCVVLLLGACTPKQEPITFKDGSVFEPSKGITEQEAKANPEFARSVAQYCYSRDNNGFKNIDESTCTRVRPYLMWLKRRSSK
jgi:hypothetical protein